MKKIKILMLHLNHGGVEKQTITMANNLVDNYQVEIISFYKLASNPAYLINPKIKIKYLCSYKPNRIEFKAAIKEKNIIKIFKEGFKALKILHLKKALIKKEIILDDADIYFSTRTEYGELLSKYGKSGKLKITEEHNFFDDIKYKNRIVKGYKNLDYIVVISKYHKNMYDEWFKEEKPKIVKIENILDHYPKNQSSLKNNSIIAVGRFNYIKDFDSLIEVTRIAVLSNPTLKLYLLGDGEEKDKLIAKIKDYNLEKNIIMPGFVSSNKVEEYMLKSDIYVMTSIRECFPMVLLEAYSCGLPVISFDILAGPKEIVKDNKTGILIKNRDNKLMAKKINELLFDQKFKEQLGINAKEEAKKYGISKIKSKWINLMK